MTTISTFPTSATDTSITPEDMIQRAEELVPLLRERSAEVDQNRRIHDDTYRRLLEAGFLHMLKPKKFGGFEMSEHEHARVAMTLAKGCASTAWTFSILSSDNMAILAFPDETQEEIWGENSFASLAGNTNLNPKAEVKRVKGGYLLTTRMGFCSGSDFSEWLVFNAPIDENDDGHMFLVPTESAERIDDWHPTGMRGSGSRSMGVTEVFVPDRRVQKTSDTVQKLKERRSLHPTFDAMYATWPSHGRFPFAACALGAALGAAEHFIATAGTSTRVANALGGSVSLAEQDYVATEFAQAHGDLQMAKLLLEDRSRQAAQRARDRIESSSEEVASDYVANAHIARVALSAVQQIFSLIGSKAGSPSHPVSIAKRDIEMISHHVTLNWRQAASTFFKTVTSK